MFVEPALPLPQPLAERFQQRGEVRVDIFRDAQRLEFLKQRSSARNELVLKFAQRCVGLGDGPLRRFFLACRQRLVLFGIRLLAARLGFRRFAFPDRGLVFLGLLDAFVQRRDFAVDFVGRGDVAGRVGMRLRTAERAGLAILQLRAEILELRDLREQRLFPQQGVLVGAVFAQQPIFQQRGQRLLFPLELRGGARLLALQLLRLRGPGVERLGRLPRCRLGVLDGLRLPDDLALFGDQAVHLLLHAGEVGDQPFIGSMLDAVRLDAGEFLRHAAAPGFFGHHCLLVRGEARRIAATSRFAFPKSLFLIGKPLIQRADLRDDGLFGLQGAFGLVRVVVGLARRLGRRLGIGFEGGEGGLLFRQRLVVVPLLRACRAERGEGAFQRSGLQGPGELFGFRLERLARLVKLAGLSGQFVELLRESVERGEPGDRLRGDG